MALVTRAGHGIGEAFACAFAAEGARVVFADIDADAASATARAIPSSLLSHALQLDEYRCAELRVTLVGGLNAGFELADLTLAKAITGSCALAVDTWQWDNSRRYRHAQDALE